MTAFFYRIRAGQLIRLDDIVRTDPHKDANGNPTDEGAVAITMGHSLAGITVQRDRYNDIEAELMEHGLLEPDETPSRAVMGDVIRRFVAINEKFDERGSSKYLRAYQDLYRVADGRAPLPAEVLGLKFSLPHAFQPGTTPGLCECRYGIDGTIDDTRVHTKQ